MKPEIAFALIATHKLNAVQLIYLGRRALDHEVWTKIVDDRKDDEILKGLYLVAVQEGEELKNPSFWSAFINTGKLNWEEVNKIGCMLNLEASWKDILDTRKSDLSVEELLEIGYFANNDNVWAKIVEIMEE